MDQKHSVRKRERHIEALDFIYTSPKERSSLLDLYNAFVGLGAPVRLIHLHRRNWFKRPSRRLAPTIVASYDRAIDRARDGGWHGRSIYVDHGLSPVKYYAYRYRTFHECDLLFYPGPVFQEIMTVLNPGFQAGLLGGLPKMDEMIRFRVDRERMCRDLRLDPRKPIILFAPTWGGKYRRDWGISNARHLAAMPNLLAVPHPADRRAARKLSIQVPDPKWSTGKLIALADVVVSDVSSVLGEAAILNKPLVQMILPGFPGCFPEPEKRREGLWLGPEQLEMFASQADPLKRPFKLAYLDEDWILGHTALPEDLPTAIQAALAEPDRFQDERNHWARRCCWRPDGKTIPRMMEMITHFLDTGELKQVG